MPQIGVGAQTYETAFQDSRVAVAADIDELGHVNNTVYLKWAQDIAVKHWSVVAPEAMQNTFFFVVLRHEVDYRDAILPGDAVEVRTWLGRASGPRFDRHVDIRKKGAKRFSAKVRTTWCMLSVDTKRPQRITPDVFQAFGVKPEELD